MLLNNVKEKKCVFCLFPLEISRWEEEGGGRRENGMGGAGDWAAGRQNYTTCRQR